MTLCHSLNHPIPVLTRFGATSIATCLQLLRLSLPLRPPPARNLDVGLGDLARGVGAGALDLVGGIGELAGQASKFGKEQGGKSAEEVASGGGDYLEQSRANIARKLSPVLDFVAGAGELATSGGRITERRYEP